MKIAYISSGFLADCDLPLLKAMQEKGQDVYYFLFMSDSSKQATLVNVKHLYRKGALYPANYYPELANLAAYLPINHIYVINMPTPHDWAMSSIHAVWKVFRFIKKNNFEIIHLTWPLRYGQFPLYLLRKRMVLTMHDPIPHSSNTDFINRFHRWVAFKLIKNFIVLSQSLKENFINTYKLYNKNVSVSRLGTYDVLLNVKPQKIETSSSYILYVGSINPHKGIKFLCEAMNFIKEQIPDLQLIIAGRGNFDFNIAEYQKNLNIKVINRFLTEEELVYLIHMSKFVVCPYIDATQSGVVMSAFTLNKPVVATNVGALSEMIENRRHGLLVPPQNSKEIAHAIIKMCQGDTLLEMSKNIQEDFREGKNSWEKIAEETINIYQNLK